MQVNLLLDQTLPNGGKSVKDITDSLFKMMEVPVGRRRRQPELACPPLVTFQWGEMIPFKAACTSLTVAFQLFKPNGTPIRADVKLALTQAERAPRRRARTPANRPTQPDDALGGRARRARRAATATRCSRSPTRPTATRTAGGSIAEANGVDNPLHLRRGTALNLPRLD